MVSQPQQDIQTQLFILKILLFEEMFQSTFYYNFSFSTRQDSIFEKSIKHSPSSLWRNSSIHTFVTTPM